MFRNHDYSNSTLDFPNTPAHVSGDAFAEKFYFSPGVGHNTRLNASPGAFRR
jgi:hypothetical protein